MRGHEWHSPLVKCTHSIASSWHLDPFFATNEAEWALSGVVPLVRAAGEQEGCKRVGVKMLP